MNSAATRNAISSQASASGPSRFDRRDGVTNVRSGPEAVRANLSARQAKEKVHPMNDICGPFGTSSSEPADQNLLSENRSQAQLSLGSGQPSKCSHCGESKNISDFSRTGYKKTYRTVCKACRNAAAREWQSKRRSSAATRASKLIAGAKARSLAKGLPFDLDVPWLQSKLDCGRCEATGVRFDMNTRRGWNTPSLDRINPAQGYTKSNTRLVLFALNAACGDWGETRLLQIASIILKERRERSEALSFAIAEKLKEKTDSLGSTLYNLTWKTRTTPSGRSIPALRASALRTSGNGSISELSGWPTPHLNSATGAGTQGRDGGLNIQTAADLAGWPTPTTQSPNSLRGNGQDPMKRKAQGHAVNLTDAVNYIDTTGPARLTVSGEMLTGCSAGMASGGQLSPAHSLWLMLGPFATAWLNCAERVIRSSSRKQRLLLKPFRRASDGA